jgi:hypothetical protein
VLGLVVLFALIRAGMHLFRGDEPVDSSSWETRPATTTRVPDDASSFPG